VRDEVDIPSRAFDERGWDTMLFIPIVTRHGTFMLQVAGKKASDLHAKRFSIVDEELLVLTGQQFVHMVTQYDLLEHMNGLLKIMAMDASQISIGFLSDKVVELSKAQRGTIFIVDGEELYFMVDTPSGGKEEIRIPLSSNSMAGTAIISGNIINIPDCYQDDRFDPAIDRKTGFKTTQMLCVPVSDTKGKPIGAIQVINTQYGMSFTHHEVELLEAFRVYIQVAVANKGK